MPRGFGRLTFLGRRSARADASPSDDAAPVRTPTDPELAPLGPPILLPRVIVRQLLFDATELVPAWAKPRPGPVSAPPSQEPKTTKPARRPRASASSTAKGVAKGVAKGTAKPRSRTRGTSSS